MKKITKVMSVFLAVLMAFGVMSVAVSAEECVHEYGKWIISQDETCAEPGIKYRKCELCDAVETGLVPALGHIFGEEKVIAPTCASEGYTSSVCENCGEEKRENIVAKLPHTYGEWAVEKEATCTEDGLKVKTCSACSADAAGHTESEVIPALGHDMQVKEVIAPSYTADGYTIYDCTRCDKTENRDVVPMLNGKVTSVDIGENIVIKIGETAQVVPDIKFEGNLDLEKCTITFESDNEKVAVVDANGNITGKGALLGANVKCTVVDEYGNTVSDEIGVKVDFSLANWFEIIVQVLKAAIDIVLGGLFGSLIK